MFTYNIIAARCAQAIHVHAAIFLRRRCDRILFGLIVRIAHLGYEPEAAERAAPRTNLFQLCMRHRPRAARLCILDPRRLSVARRDAAHSASRGTQSDTWLIDAALPLFISRRIENAALADWRLRVAGLDGICPGIAFCRSDDPIYVNPFRDEKIRAPSAHDSANAAVQRVFAEQHVYRDGELTVASLALKLAMPEYRLRKLIHEQLGYRNFNALLHDYRIAEACRALADPAKNSLPILTIALTVGYNSINPFNRAFRDAKGMTPSAYRAQAQAGTPILPTKQTLTES
jgi:AraC-like DNA-binding protein